LCLLILLTFPHSFRKQAIMIMWMTLITCTRVLGHAYLANDFNLWELFGMSS